MALIADGSLTLDASVRDLLDDDALELVDPSVTVRHLLGHTSGIGDYLDESVLTDVDDYILPVPVHRLATPADFLTVLGGHPMKFAPGDHFEYCNGGYLLLALIVEAASGRSYYEVVADRVCRPAGMEATAYLRSDELPGAAAIGYIPAEGGWRTNQLHLPVRGCGDGGAHSTIADFCAFWPALLAGGIIATDLVAEMTRAHEDVPENSLRYGLGFWLRADRDTVMLEGYDAGISFRSAYDPASKLLYTVMANTSAGAWPLVRLLDEMFPLLS
jgi:CubicO group peptidase (beta-lactamase class C family)